MSYIKPELLILSVVTHAVRTSGRDGTSGGIQDSTKAVRIAEAGAMDDYVPPFSDGQLHTSSSGSAYEADE